MAWKEIVLWIIIAIAFIFNFTFTVLVIKQVNETPKSDRGSQDTARMTFAAFNLVFSIIFLLWLIYYYFFSKTGRECIRADVNALTLLGRGQQGAQQGAQPQFPQPGAQLRPPASYGSQVYVAPPAPYALQQGYATVGPVGPGQGPEAPGQGPYAPGQGPYGGSQKYFKSK